MTTLKRNMPLIHPGELMKAELMEANGLTVTEVAGMLKVSRQALLILLTKRQT